MCKGGLLTYKLNIYSISKITLSEARVNETGYLFSDLSCISARKDRENCGMCSVRCLEQNNDFNLAFRWSNTVHFLK